MSSSCNNSSNIAGNLTINSLQAVGSRLITVVPNTPTVQGGIVDGITAGDVVRYDVLSNPKIYTKAQANDPATAEVIGVVEAVTDANVTLVLSGQMKYPEGAFAVFDPDGDGPLGSTGGAGGNDIYFLSAITGGLLQSYAPSEPTNIVKPVLQMADNGDFNAIVQNYIGYQVGGNVVASEGEDSFAKLGQVIDVVTYGTKNYLGDGWYRVDEPLKLAVDEFSDFYSLYGTKYGYAAVISIDDSSRDSFSTSILNTPGIYNQKNGRETTKGRITSVISKNQVEIEVNPTLDGTSNIFTTDSTVFVDGRSYGKPTNVTITHVYTPGIVKDKDNERIIGYGGVNMRETTVPFMKLRNLNAVTVHDKLTVSELEVTSKLTALSQGQGKTISDVAALLSDHDNNIDTHSGKFGVTSSKTGTYLTST